jgi:hypothetical protein
MFPPVCPVALRDLVRRAQRAERESAFAINWPGKYFWEMGIL